VLDSRPGQFRGRDQGRPLVLLNLAARFTVNLARDGPRSAARRWPANSPVRRGAQRPTLAAGPLRHHGGRQVRGARPGGHGFAHDRGNAKGKNRWDSGQHGTTGRRLIAGGAQARPFRPAWGLTPRPRHQPRSAPPVDSTGTQPRTSDPVDARRRKSSQKSPEWKVGSTTYRSGRRCLTRPGQSESNS